MRLGDLAVVVADHIGAIAVQHTGTARRERRGMASRFDAVARGFGADQLDLAVVEKRMEDADRVRAAADAGRDRIGQAPVLIEHLRARLAADDRIEVAHHHRIRMRPGDRADDVERIGHVGHPVAHRFVERVLQGLRARSHRHHLGTEQFHPVDVDLLPLDVDRAHVDDAVEAETRGNRGAGDAVLAGAGLGNDAALAHALGDERLADRVIDLVRAGVVQIFALEQDLCAADFLRQAFGVIDRARPADVVLQVAVEFGNEIGILAQAQIGLAQFRQRFHQGFGDIQAAVVAEAAMRIGILRVIDGRGGCVGIERVR